MAVILPAVPGLMRLDLDWETQSKNWSTALRVIKSIAGPWSSGDIAQVLTSLAGYVTEFILPRYGADTVSSGYKATDLSSSMGLVEVDTGSGGGTGLGTRPLPVNVALRNSYVSPLRYRGGRPGESWSGLDQTDMATTSATLWSTSVQAAWLSAIESLISGMNIVALPSGATMKCCWVSYFTGHALRPTPLVFEINAAGGVQVQQRICSRRRRLGRGVPGE